MTWNVLHDVSRAWNYSCTSRICAARGPRIQMVAHTLVLWFVALALGANEAGEEAAPSAAPSADDVDGSALLEQSASSAAPMVSPTAAPTVTFEEMKGSLHAFFAKVSPHIDEMARGLKATALASRYQGDEAALNAHLRLSFGGADVRGDALNSRSHSLSYHPGMGVRPADPTTWQLHRVDAATVVCLKADASDCPRQNFSVEEGIYMPQPNPVQVRRKPGAKGAAPWKHCYDACALRFGCEAYSTQSDHEASDGVVYCYLYGGSPLLRQGPGDDGITRTSALMPDVESAATRAWRAKRNKRNALHSTVCRIFGTPFAERFNEASAAEEAWEHRRRKFAAEAKQRGAPLRIVQLHHLRALTNFWAVVPFDSSSHRSRKHSGFEAESWARFDMSRCCDASVSMYIHQTSSDNTGAVPCASGAADDSDTGSEFPDYYGATKGGIWDLQQSCVRWSGNTGYDVAFNSAVESAHQSSILDQTDANFAAASEGLLHHKDDPVLSGLLPMFPFFPIELNGEFALGDAAAQRRKTRAAAVERKMAIANAATKTMNARERSMRFMKTLHTPSPTPFTWSESHVPLCMSLTIPIVDAALCSTVHSFSNAVTPVHPVLTAPPPARRLLSSALLRYM